MIGGAISGLDYRYIFVNNKRYKLHPPTIHKLAGAGKYLSQMREAENLYDMIASLQDLPKACKALSWFLVGNESLYKELSDGMLDEILLGLTEALNMVDARNFLLLSGLMKSVKNLIAKQR